MDKQTQTRKLRAGMIGGGPGSFIGAVHRICMNLDGLYELVAGSFSSSYEKSKETGKELNIDDSRVYKSYKEMIEKEIELDASVRIELVVICTPNNAHFEPTKLALENGFHVVLDKPLCLNLQEAYDLESIVKNNKPLFCLTHTYTGYPMIKEAKSIISSGRLGKIRKVCVEYPQGWLTKSLEKTGHKQAEWRNDPLKAGDSCCLGDIGTHAFNLAEYVTSSKVTDVCADISTFVENRILEDDASILLRFDNGSKGFLQASQILTGEENSLGIRVWGELGAIEWNQRDCNTILLKMDERPTEIYRAGSGNSYLFQRTKDNLRTPGGHPEGYLEAFANIYRNFALTVLGKNTESHDFPGIEDGVRGMLFVSKCLESGKSNEKWTKL